jgi:DNA-binding response OmpR family regulator
VAAAAIALYSSDSATREAVKAALGARVAYGMPVVVSEFTTAPELFDALRLGGFDLLIADAEATPYGGMGVARTIKNELSVTLPIVLLVAREADAWLATWSRAEAVSRLPIDPLQFPQVIAALLRGVRKGTDTPLEAEADPEAGISSRHQNES